MDRAAFQGPLGALVRVIAPHTEAAPEGLLLQALAIFGSIIGRGPYYLVEAAKHYPNLYVCLVGDTSKGRKGTSLNRIMSPLGGIDKVWAAKRCVHGLSSGEGLIYEVRDRKPTQDSSGERESSENAVTTECERDERRVTPARKGIGFSTKPSAPTEDNVNADRRLLVIESELASVLKAMARQGNTLSAVLRSAWDDGNLSTLTRTDPMRAAGAHIAVIGHITSDEVRRYLNQTERGNGFANRFLWAMVKRVRLLPVGGAPRNEELTPVVGNLSRAVEFARTLGEREVPFDRAARKLWDARYEALSDGPPGMLGFVTSRAEAQTVRLALLYALADRSRQIKRVHLEAALAMWDYCLRSARYIFGGKLGDPLADDLLALLRRAGDDGLDREALHNALGRHRRAEDVGRALELLERTGLATLEREATGGRPREVWRAVDPDAQEAQDARKG